MAGTWTYAGTAAGTITTARDKVRLEIGDTDSSAPLVYDEELDVYLGNYSNSILKTAAAVCDMLAVKFARYYDFDTDGQSFKRSQMSKQYAELAKTLKNRATGLVALDTTRVDGYSSDVATSDVGASDENPRQKYVTFGHLDDAP
ncbi:MAG: hypothetical protein M0R37_07660 [Bacteroidales bacterium]|nr:hypothetical protein [Bacteroidales bacterium]